MAVGTIFICMRTPQDGFCGCGCGKKTNLRHDKPFKYLQRHGNSSHELRTRHSQRMKGRQYRPETIRRMSKSASGRTHSVSHTANGIRSRTGRDPIYSPILPGVPVHYVTRNKRWMCVNPRNGGNPTTHAKRVWETFNEPVPSGYAVHHKNGDASKLEYDSPDNLMLLTKQWNFKYLPLLAEGFGVPESEVTNAHIRAIEKHPTENLFAATCDELLLHIHHTSEVVE